MVHMYYVRSPAGTGAGNCNQHINVSAEKYITISTEWDHWTPQMASRKFRSGSATKWTEKSQCAAQLLVKNVQSILDFRVGLKHCGPVSLLRGRNNFISNYFKCGLQHSLSFNLFLKDHPPKLTGSWDFLQRRKWPTSVAPLKRSQIVMSGSPTD